MVGNTAKITVLLRLPLRIEFENFQFLRTVGDLERTDADLHTMMTRGLDGLTGLTNDLDGLTQDLEELQTKMDDRG